MTCLEFDVIQSYPAKLITREKIGAAKFTFMRETNFP